MGTNKSSICWRVKGKCGVAVEEAAIIPVCREWVLTAHQLQHGSFKEGLNLKAIECLIMAEPYTEDTEKLYPIKIVTKLLAANEIAGLEKL